jgi:hypothetical protein
MLAHDESEERAAALTSIRLDATSRIVAGILMPVRFFAEAVVWAVAAPAVIVLGLRDGTASTVYVAGVVAVAFVTLTLSTRRGIRLYLERSRIASEYRRGLAVTEARRVVLHQMEGGQRIEFVFALAFSGGACALALGVGLALSGEHVDGWPLALMVGGGYAAWGALDLLGNHARRQHPMRPSRHEAPLGDQS